MTQPTPHLDKLNAAIANPKSSDDDKKLLTEALEHYYAWIKATTSLKSKGRDRVNEMVACLNEYKDCLEVELIAKRGSAFLKRQKGQLKLDNSVNEEFFPHLVIPEIMTGLNHARFTVGPQKAFMSLAFMPHSFEDLGRKPEVVLKVKDQDFAIGSTLHYKFSASGKFDPAETESGAFALAVVAAECKVNLDKTMFQEACGTAARLKHGCPVARYFVLVEYLDMTPEDTRLTEVDNVFLLRKAKRLPYDKRANAVEVEAQHRDHPICSDVVWAFVEEIREFISAIWYDPDEALRRGSFAPVEVRRPAEEEGD